MPSRPLSAPSVTTGVALKLLSALVFALMNAAVKFKIGAYPVSEIVLFRSVFGLVVLIAWLAAQGRFPSAIRTHRPSSHVLRGVAGSAGMYCGFLALSLLPLSDATALGYASPLIVVVIAALFLGETVRIARWSAVALGFCGVIVMLWSHLGASDHPSADGTLGVAVALGGAAFGAIAVVQTRRLTESEDTGAIVFYYTSMTTVISLALLVLGRVWPADAPWADVLRPQGFVMPAAGDLVGLAAIGLLGGFAQILLTQSCRHAEASVIACFDYSNMVWAVAIGFFLFGELPTGNVVAGAAIVMTAGGIVLWRESGQARRAARGHARPSPARPIAALRA